MPLSFCQEPVGYIHGEFKFMGGDPSFVLKEGDVITYQGWAPHQVDGADQSAEKGFMITAWAGYNIQWLHMQIAAQFLNKPMVACVWRRIQNAAKKKPYEPSFWAKPLPLP